MKLQVGDVSIEVARIRWQTRPVVSEDGKIVFMRHDISVEEAIMALPDMAIDDLNGEA